MNCVELLRDPGDRNRIACSLEPSLESKAFDVAVTFEATAVPAVFENLRLRTGQSVVIRLLKPEDREALQVYFETLSPGARRNRFIGASNGPSIHELDQLFHRNERNRFALVAVMMVNGVETIVGEARYMFDQVIGGFEFGLSVHDDRRGQGIGFAVLSTLERLAAAFGASDIFADTLRTNIEMQALARKAGFSFANTPGDWRERHMTKPCLTVPCLTVPRTVHCAPDLQAAA